MAEKYAPSYRQGSLYRPVQREQEAVPENDYRALSGLAVVSAILGVLSLLTFLHWALVVVPVVGMLVGWMAIKRIDRTPEELTGRNVALAGLSMSLIFWTAGYSWLVYQTFYSTPSGYVDVDFAELQPNPNDPEQFFPEAADMLDNRKVLIRGFMLPTRQTRDIREFTIAREAGDSCGYCVPKPKPTELIHVKMVGNSRADFTQRLVTVGGAFKLQRDPAKLRSGSVIYEVEADFFQ